jgi:hypothetical protein
MALAGPFLVPQALVHGFDIMIGLLLEIIGVVKHSFYRVHVVLNLSAEADHISKGSLGRDHVGENNTP